MSSNKKVGKTAKTKVPLTDRYDKKEVVDAVLSATAMMGMQTVIAARILGIAVIEMTDEIPTLAVTMPGDGILRLLVNPEFFMDELGDSPSQQKFVLAHEAYHLILAHVSTESVFHYRNTVDTRRLLAEEGVINRLVQQHLSVRDALVPPKIVKPQDVYRQYVKAAKAKNVTPPSDSDFWESEETAYSYMCAVDFEPTKQLAAKVCVTFGNCSESDIPPPPGQSGPPQKGSGTQGEDSGTGDEDGDDGEQAASPVSPSDLVENSQEWVGGELEGMIRDALDEESKDTKLESQLRDMVSSIQSDEAQTTWGNLGADQLRSVTVRRPASPLWESLTRAAVKSVLSEEEGRIEYNRKVGHMVSFLLPTGEDYVSRVGVFMDTSGSVTSETCNRVAQLVGRSRDIEASYFSFDTELHALKPGEPLKGGGGTCFEPIVEKVRDEDRNEPFDAVIVVTDGYAPQVEPRDKYKWVWVITQDGDTWPATRGMRCVEIDEDFRRVTQVPA